MIEVTRIGTVTILKISGRFDFASVPQFQELLDHKPTEWVVDLTETIYVDSAALGMLLILRDHATAQGRVALRGAHGMVREVLTMARFDRMFVLEPA